MGEILTLKIWIQTKTESQTQLKVQLKYEKEPGIQVKTVFRNLNTGEGRSSPSRSVRSDFVDFVRPVRRSLFFPQKSPVTTRVRSVVRRPLHHGTVPKIRPEKESGVLLGSLTVPGRGRTSLWVEGEPPPGRER